MPIRGCLSAFPTVKIASEYFLTVYKYLFPFESSGFPFYLAYLGLLNKGTVLHGSPYMMLEASGVNNLVIST